MRRLFNRYYAGKCFRFLELGSEFDVYSNNSGYYSNPDRKIKLHHYTYARCIKVSFVLGHGFEIMVEYNDASKPSKMFNVLRLGHNSMLDLVFDEISESKYLEIRELFIAPDEINECDKLSNGEMATLKSDRGTYVTLYG